MNWGSSAARAGRGRWMCGRGMRLGAAGRGGGVGGPVVASVLVPRERTFRAEITKGHDWPILTVPEACIFARASRLSAVVGWVVNYPSREYRAAMSADPLSRITIRAEQCHGRPCIRGMRIRVVDVLAMLANGSGEDEILADFPDLERDDIRACLAYAVAQLGHPVVVAAE
jgi:uncharacterized protein (DUF433 family)